MDEAKQFYPLFGLGANVALIFSGRAVVYFSQVPLGPRNVLLLQILTYACAWYLILMCAFLYITLGTAHSNCCTV